MFSRFFIDRPIFATVLSLIFILAGAISMINLPVAQYPELTPPTIFVQARYPGASSETVAETVASTLEQKINGVDDMIYMNSVVSSNGDSATQVYFKVGTDPDQAMINVNNRVQMATASLPEEVRRYGVVVQKRSSAILRIMALYTDDPRYDATYLGNYALVHLIDELKRLEGVGDASVVANNDYAIRIWIKPDKLAKLGLTTTDIINAVSTQNAQRAAGKIGAKPVNVKVDRNYLIVAKGRFTTPEEFNEIILRADEKGRVLKLKDVANITLGAQTYDINGTTKGYEAAPIMIMLSPGANALATVERVEKKMQELSANFPKGIHLKVIYDTSGFVKNSIKEVVKTLFEAFFLVFLVIILFLKNFRATLIPCLAVPVSIIGAFAGMMVFDFSINTLTLFGLVLAISIVVDDAIIVIENVERIMKTEKISVRDATIKSMDEVSGALVAIVLVLCSVFIPVAFMGGFTGTMYKQFAITIAVSVIISGFVALTLTPALCVIFLKNMKDSEIAFLEKFEIFFKNLTEKYTNIVEILLNYRKISYMIIAGILALTVLIFKVTPSALLPEEDQGVLISCALLDPAASAERSEKTAQKITAYLEKNPAVEDYMSIVGYNLLSSCPNSNAATLFVKLKDWSVRTEEKYSAASIVRSIFAAGASFTDGLVLAFSPPAIVGMSTTGGFEAYIQKTDGVDSKVLADKTAEFVAALSKRPELTNISTTFNASSPQFKLNVDEEKALSLGLNLNDIYRTIESTFGSYYINDFTKLGRNFKVMIQAEGDYRAYPEQINELYVRSSHNAMIPLSSCVELTPSVGPDIVERFNVFPAAKILGNPANGYTSGEAIAAVEEVAKEVLGTSYLLSWTGSAYQEKSAGDSSSLALILGLVVVFLILAAQYERWSLPLAVIFSVPFGVFGAILAVFLRGFSNDIYFQIALVTLVGLSAKNAILIVEFAVILREQGMSIFDAAVKAAKLRFRPIIMTSMAMVLGCLPLAISTGAGSASRHSLGTGIIGGVLGTAVIAPFFIPLFYFLVTTISEKLTGSTSSSVVNEGGQKNDK